MKILVPLDGSPLAEEALSRGITLARRWGAEVVLVRVVDTFRSLPAHTPDLALRLNTLGSQDASDYLKTACARAGDEGVKHVAMVVYGEPATQILKLARSQNVSLICLSSHGRTGVTRWLIGSVAEAVLRQAPCPVLMCRGRRRAEDEAFRRVVAPQDGSPLAAEVLTCLQPFLSEDARVTLLRAPDELVRQSALRLDPEMYSDYLTGLEKELTALDPEERFARRVVDLPPAEAVLAVADEEQADLIALSTHGRTGFRRMMLGSVAERVARHAECSVLALPPGAMREATRQAQGLYETAPVG